MAESPKIGNSSSQYINMVATSATGEIAAYNTTEGAWVGDLYQTTSTVSGTSFLHLYFQQGTVYWHPYDGTNPTNTTYNNLFISANPGYIYKITYSSWHSDGDGNKWFDYSVSTLGHFFHFDSSNGVLPSSQDATIEVAQTTTSLTLPAACTRATNDGYVFDKWVYNGNSYSAGASVSLDDTKLSAEATYKVTAASFASFLMDSARDSETCATKYAAAKILADKMSSDEKALFTPANYANAYPRWQAWKAANADTTTNPSAIVTPSDKTSAVVLGGLAALAVLAAGAYFFIRKKKVD